jgi:hypothetical protein
MRYLFINHFLTIFLRSRTKTNGGFVFPVVENPPVKKIKAI